MPRKYAEDGKSFSIEVSAPIFFFGVQMPSGITYSEDIADAIVKKLEDGDIPIMAQVGTLTRKIGTCYNIVKKKDEAQDTGVLLANLALSPSYQWLEDQWDMQRTRFQTAVEAQVPEDKKLSMQNVVKIPYIYAHLNIGGYK